MLGRIFACKLSYFCYLNPFYFLVVAEIMRSEERNKNVNIILHFLAKSIQKSLMFKILDLKKIINKHLKINDYFEKMICSFSLREPKRKRQTNKVDTVLLPLPIPVLCENNKNVSC